MFTQGFNGHSVCLSLESFRVFSPPLPRKFGLRVWAAARADVVWCGSGAASGRRMSFAVTRTGSAAAVVVKLRRGERVKAEPVRALMLLTHTAR